MVGFNYLKSLTCIFFKTEFKINLQFDGDTREKNPDRGERRSFFPPPLDEFQKWSVGLSFEHEALTIGPPFLLSLRISTTCKHWGEGWCEVKRGQRSSNHWPCSFLPSGDVIVEVAKHVHLAEEVMMNIDKFFTGSDVSFCCSSSVWEKKRAHLLKTCTSR